MNVHSVLLLGLLAYEAYHADTSAGPPKDQRSQTVALSESEEAWRQAHPVVWWGLDPHWPPFSYTNRDGQLIGIDVELTRTVAERVGLNLQLVPTSSWSESLARARAGQIDVLSATAETEERLPGFEYSREYGTFPVVIISRTSGPFFTSLHALRAAKIAMPRDHVTTEQLQRDYPEMKLLLTGNTEQALLRVSYGEVDATVVNLAVAGYSISARGLANLKISGVTSYEFPLRFAVSSKDDPLRSILDKGLDTITPQEQNTVYAKYLHPALVESRDWGRWRLRAFYTFLVALGLLSIALLWNRTMVRQIHHSRSVEAELRQARDKLEQHTQELDRRVKDVERLNRELTVANKDLDAFSSSVSHDLRAPLRRLNAFGTLLQNELGDSARTNVREYCQIIDQEAGHMCQLIDDLLAFARVGRIELRMERVDMDVLAKQVVHEFSLETYGRDIHWRVGALPAVLGDAGLLRQVLVNLIDNAVKFTRKRDHTEIEIQSSPSSSGKNGVMFWVKDNGCGFDMRDAKTLFNAFHRLHSSAEYEGTGIGLVNVQRIIQRHGGRVWAESSVGRGAVFYFSLPNAI